MTLEGNVIYEAYDKSAVVLGTAGNVVKVRFLGGGAVD